MNKNSLILPIIIVAFIFIAYNFFFKRSPVPKGALAPIEATSNQGSAKPSAQTHPTSGIPTAEEYESRVAANKKAPTNMPDMNQIKDYYEQQSLKALTDFTNTAKLRFKAPMKMNFQTLDLHDNVLVGTYGASEDKKTGMTVLATKLNPTNQTVASFLKESSGEIPNLKGKNISWTKDPKTFPAPKQTGITEAKVWVGVDSQGNSYAAALMPRSDANGTYLFVYNSPGKKMFENDDYFQRMLSEIRTSPP